MEHEGPEGVRPRGEEGSGGVVAHDDLQRRGLVGGRAGRHGAAEAGCRRPHRARGSTQTHNNHTRPRHAVCYCVLAVTCSTDWKRATTQKTVLTSENTWRRESAADDAPSLHAGRRVRRVLGAQVLAAAAAR